MKLKVRETLDAFKELDTTIKVFDNKGNPVIECSVNHLFDNKHNTLLNCKTKNFDQETMTLVVNSQFKKPYKK